MRKLALVLGIGLSLAGTSWAALSAEEQFNQEACNGSRLGKEKCVRKLKVYCSRPNKWQDGAGKWQDGPSPRQREMCYRWKT